MIKVKISSGVLCSFDKNLLSEILYISEINKTYLDMNLRLLSMYKTYLGLCEIEQLRTEHY